MSWGRGEERKFLQNQVSLLPRSSPKQGPGLEAVDTTTVCFLVGEWLLDYPDCQIEILTRAGMVWGAGQVLPWSPPCWRPPCRALDSRDRTAPGAPARHMRECFSETVWGPVGETEAQVMSGAAWAPHLGILGPRVCV